MANTNGDSRTLTGSITTLANNVVSALPPAFLLLCLVNVLFLGSVMWFLTSASEARIQLVGRILERCIDLERQHGDK